MNTPLRIDTYLPSASNQRGISRPAKVIASDGKKYFIKGNISVDSQSGKEYNMDAALAQEDIAYKLADYLSVPTPKNAYVQITENDLTDFPKLRFHHHFKSGLYLLSEYIESAALNDRFSFLMNGAQVMKALTKPFNDFMSKIVNKDDIPKIIYLDLLTANCDRYGNSGNLIFKELNDGSIMLAIDFGYCFFGPYWSAHEYFENCAKSDLLKKDYSDSSNLQILINGMKLSNSILFNALGRLITFDDGNPFIKVNHDMQLLPKTGLSALIQEVPSEWFVQGSYQKGEYLNFIERQSRAMPKILDGLANNNLFKNFEGGPLKWETEKNTISL